MSDIKKMVKIAYDALTDKKAINPKIIDISNISVLADYFIIASGANEKQVQAMADNVCEKLAENGVQPRQTEGYHSGNWILLDFNDIIVHIFNHEDRLFYDLERIWRDGKSVEIENI